MNKYQNVCLNLQLQGKSIKTLDTLIQHTGRYHMPPPPVSKFSNGLVNAVCGCIAPLPVPGCKCGNAVFIGPCMWVTIRMAHSLHRGKIVCRLVYLTCTDVTQASMYSKLPARHPELCIASSVYIHWYILYYALLVWYEMQTPLDRLVFLPAQSGLGMGTVKTCHSCELLTTEKQRFSNMASA